LSTAGGGIIGTTYAPIVLFFFWFIACLNIVF
jgi:hypothetical protein